MTLSEQGSAVVPARASSAIAVAPFADLAGPGVRATGRRAIEDAVDAGRRQGYADGYQSGLDAARHAAAASEAEHNQRVAQASRALQAAADELTRREALALDTVADAVARGALALAEVIIGRELAVAGRAGVDAVTRALALAPTGDATVRLHPDDIRQLEKVEGDQWPRELVPGRALTIVADPLVEPGGCIAEVGPCRIDAQISSALDRARESLA